MGRLPLQEMFRGIPEAGERGTWNVIDGYSYVKTCEAIFNQQDKALQKVEMKAVCCWICVIQKLKCKRALVHSPTAKREETAVASGFCTNG